MDYTTFALVALIATLASALQSFVGFGFALFAIPPMIMLGLSLPEAVAISLAGTFVQGLAAAVKLHGHIQWRAIGLPAAVRMLAIPAGLLLMVVLVRLGETPVKQAVGVALLVALALWVAVRVQPRERLGMGWGMAAGLGSGLLSGSVGMGGPPCVLWALGHRWSSEQLRASLFTIFSLSVPLQLFLLWRQFGMKPVHAGLLGFLLTPLIIAGAALGLWLSAHLPIVYLRRAMIGLLAGMALYAILTPVVQGMMR